MKLIRKFCHPKISLLLQYTANNRAHKKYCQYIQISHFYYIPLVNNRWLISRFSRSDFCRPCVSSVTPYTQIAMILNKHHNISFTSVHRNIKNKPVRTRILLTYNSYRIYVLEKLQATLKVVKKFFSIV